MMGKIFEDFIRLDPPDGRNGRPTPEEVINWINDNLPQYKGLCYYHEEDRCLASKKPETLEFHFDPFYSVLHVLEIEAPVTE